MKAILKSSLISLFIIGAMSCKQKEETKTASNQNQSTPSNSLETNKPKFFYVTLKAIFKESDLVQVFYTQSHNETFSSSQVLSKQVEPSSEIQDIVLEMPKEDYPYNIRIDLSNNKNQSAIKIQEFVLHYGNKNYKILAKDMTKYLIPNTGVEISSDSTIFNLKTHKHLGVEKFDPFMVGNDEMINVLMIEL